MPSQRGYRDGCGIAHGLDLVGERWALLVVRELILGPKRFTDLRRGLPAASPNALADRLRELAAAGVVRRRRLRPPAASWVYELTDWGRELEPILIALGSWAVRSSLLDDTGHLSADSIMLTIRTYYRGVEPGPPARLDVRLLDETGEDRFGVWLADGRADPRHDLPPDPDVAVTAGPRSLLATFGDSDRMRQALADGTIVAAGDTSVLDRLATGIAVPGPAPAEARR